MDEAVGVNADCDPLHDLEGAGAWPYFVEALAKLGLGLG
jgi:hypothetical protein